VDDVGVERSDVQLSHEALLRYARDVVTVVDEQGTVRYYNRTAVEHVLGEVPRNAVGMNAQARVHPDDLAYAGEARRTLMAVPGSTTTTVMRVQTTQGWRHVETVGVNLLHDPDVQGLLYVTRDVEDRIQERADLERAVAGQQLVARLALDALSDRDARGATERTLADVAALLAAPTIALALRDGVRIAQHVDAPVGEGETVVIEARLGALAVGTLSAAPRLVPYSRADLELLHAVADVLAGAWARADDERRALERALHDPLTGLATRPLLRDRLEHALADQRSSHALLLVDLDAFKQVNDRFGHAAGDAVLRQVGPRLVHCVRPTDTVARYGGDEFVVLCENVADCNVVTGVVERIRRACAQPFALPDGEQILLSGSVGVAWASGGQVSADELLRQADQQMYRDKRSA